MMAQSTGLPSMGRHLDAERCRPLRLEPGFLIRVVMSGCSRRGKAGWTVVSRRHGFTLDGLVRSLCELAIWFGPGARLFRWDLGAGMNSNAERVCTHHRLVEVQGKV
ncbi:MAG: hypothetical protein HKL99_10165 [Burkholderiales bacterium]|jgi:hypothetical protein|nr:hypothetical protein [Burkholderiales bacterium]